jgi:hypothetical protein
MNGREVWGYLLGSRRRAMARGDTPVSFRGTTRVSVIRKGPGTVRLVVLAEELPFDGF